MFQVKSIFFKLFITYIAILIVSHLIFVVTYFVLFQDTITNIHQNDIMQMKHLFGVASLISLTISGIFTYYLSKRITSPIRDMNQIAFQIARGQFNQVMEIKSRDELGELGETLNYMAQELAGLDQMRKDFVANVSHDLRSPLTSIHGFVTAFQDNTIPEERKDYYLAIMKEQTERMIKLVNDLLDMARIEAGQLEIHPVIFNISELTRQVIARLEPEIIKSNVEVELISEEKVDIYVLADPDRIEQVLFNLILNAIQFSPSSGLIKVQLKKEEKVIISIKDYGPGITQEEIDEIWERFYKSDKSRSKKVGTGLGLSIVKYILDLHQSPIYVNSTIGSGAEFTFELQKEKNQKSLEID